MSLWVGIQHYILSGHSYDVLFKDYMQQETYLFITTNAPHRKENGRNGVLKFFPFDDMVAIGQDAGHELKSKAGPGFFDGLQ